jgi:hypothetical protein
MKPTKRYLKVPFVGSAGCLSASVDLIEGPRWIERFGLRCPALNLFVVVGGCGYECGDFGSLFAIDNAVLVGPTVGCERKIFELVS